MEQKLAKEKREAIKLWSADPCGAHYTEEYGLGSKEFFQAAVEERYENDAPWIKRLIDSIPVKGKKVLEVGCGMGVDLLEFAKNGARVTGIDLVDNHLKLASRLFALNKLEAKLLNADAEDLPFPPEAFDIVYSFGVLHHTPNTQKAIDEVQRVLRPNGTAIVGLYHKNSWHYLVNLVFRKGILHKGLKQGTMADILSRSVEFSRTGAKPLVKVYSRRECRRLFSNFSKAKVRAYHFKKDQVLIPRPFQFLKFFLPTFLPSFLGWYLMATVKK